MSFDPKTILNVALYWLEWFYGYSLFLLFVFWLYHSCIHSLVMYKLLTISWEIRVFLITLGLQPYIHKEFDSSCFLNEIIYKVLFSFLTTFLSESNIVDHISAKHKLAWCCLHCCVIGASDSPSSWLDEVSNDLSISLTIWNFVCSLNDCICLWFDGCEL
jgi:hypothetical protein